MFFPIGDDQVNGGYKPYFSYLLMSVNILIFIFEVNLPQGQLAGFMSEYGAIPNEITQGQDLYTLFSSMFLHGSWMHLIGNMVFLWVFADNIEAIFGNFNFLGFYLLGGIIASMSHILSGPESMVPSLGASGAIAAVLGTYIVLFPLSKVKVLFLLWFIRMPAYLFLGIWIVQQLINGVGSLNAINGGGVAWWAHIGGFVFGVLIGLYARKTIMQPKFYIDDEYV